jgi:hypothetical protein
MFLARVFHRLLESGEYQCMSYESLDNLLLHESITKVVREQAPGYQQAG